MFENQVKLDIDQWAEGKAETYFIRICKEVPKDQESFVSRMRVGSHLDCRALFREYDYVPTEDQEGVKIENEIFRGGIFQYFHRKQPLKILPYLLTIGPLPQKGTNGLLEEFYVDAWGSAYVEAAHDVFKKRLQRIYGGQVFLSEPFGPGYYGIDITQTKGIFRLLDAAEIGLSLTETGMMLPEKSCSGFYVITNQPAALPEDCCEHCLSPHSCSFCRKYDG